MIHSFGIFSTSLHFLVLLIGLSLPLHSTENRKPFYDDCIFPWLSGKTPSMSHTTRHQESPSQVNMKQVDDCVFPWFDGKIPTHITRNQENRLMANGAMVIDDCIFPWLGGTIPRMSHTQSNFVISSAKIIATNRECIFPWLAEGFGNLIINQKRTIHETISTSTLPPSIMAPPREQDDSLETMHDDDVSPRKRSLSSKVEVISMFDNEQEPTSPKTTIKVEA